MSQHLDHRHIKSSLTYVIQELGDLIHHIGPNFIFRFKYDAFDHFHFIHAFSFVLNTRMHNSIINSVPVASHMLVLAPIVHQPYRPYRCQLCVRCSITQSSRVEAQHLVELELTSSVQLDNPPPHRATSQIRLNINISNFLFERSLKLPCHHSIVSRH